MECEVKEAKDPLRSFLSNEGMEAEEEDVRDPILPRNKGFQESLRIDETGLRNETRPEEPTHAKRRTEGNEREGFAFDEKRIFHPRDVKEDQVRDVSLAHRFVDLRLPSLPNTRKSSWDASRVPTFRCDVRCDAFQPLSFARRMDSMLSKQPKLRMIVSFDRQDHRYNSRQFVPRTRSWNRRRPTREIHRIDRVGSKTTIEKISIRSKAMQV